MNRKVISLSAFFLTVCLAAAYADSRAKAVSLVNDAIAFIKKNGEDKAFKDFTAKKGRFAKSELYIFIVDFNGNTLSHGGNEKLVGRNMFDLQDSDGNHFIRKFIDLAKDKGEGWIEYKWSNPATKKIESKTSYIKRMPGCNYFLGCGVYTKK